MFHKTLQGYVSNKAQKEGIGSRKFEAGCWSTYAFIGENMLGETALDICDPLSNWTHEHEWECYIMPTWITI